MNFGKIVGIFILAALLVLCSYFLLDARTALFIKKLWPSKSIFSTDIPDLLFPLVCLATSTAWIAYFYLTRKGIYNRLTQFFLLIAITIPLTFFVKSALKHMFGRINTRFWLRHPNITEFHWFQGGGNYYGFPSGHMAVFVVFIAALWKYYPAHRPAYLVFLATLTLSLIVTNYHFVSDIIAGAYLGFIIHHMAAYGLSRFHKSNNV